MAIVPEFLIKRIYQKGSLKKIENGAILNLKNILGPGVISGFNYVKINEITFLPKDVTFTTNGTEYKGTEVSEANPVVFRLGQVGTLTMAGQDCIIEGKNTITIEALNPEAGIVRLNAEDNI